MNFELTREQQDVRRRIREFCAGQVDQRRLQEVADVAATARNAGELRAVFPYELSEKLHDAGLRQLAVPREYGGEGADWMTQALAAEEVGYSGGGLSRFLTIPWHFCEYIATYGSRLQRERFFATFMENKRLCLAAAITEPQSGTDIFHPNAAAPGAMGSGYARREGESWIVDAEKMFCAGGAVAQMVFLFVRTDRERPLSEAMSCFLVPTDLPGVEMELHNMIAADIGGNVKFRFSGVRLSASSLCSELNRASAGLVHSTAVEKLIHFFGLLGISQRLYEHMKQHARQRIQGGRPIIEHANVGSLLAEAAVNLEALRALMYRAAWEYSRRETGGGATDLSPIWGHFCNYAYKKMALRLSEIGAEVYGGVGTLKSMPLESYVRYLFMMLPGGSTPVMNLMSCVPHLDDLEAGRC